LLYRGVGKTMLLNELETRCETVGWAGEAAVLRALKAFTLTVGDITFGFDVEALEGVADSGDLAEDMRDLLVEVGRAAQAGGTGFAPGLPLLPELTGEAAARQEYGRAVVRRSFPDRPPSSKVLDEMRAERL
jgi:hypothetical protein